MCTDVSRANLKYILFGRGGYDNFTDRAMRSRTTVTLASSTNRNTATFSRYDIYDIYLSVAVKKQTYFN